MGSTGRQIGRWTLLALVVLGLGYPHESAQAANDFYLELARHWSPVIYQDTDAVRPRADYITRIDYDDTPWDTTDNWENLDGFSLKAYVYYWVVESEDHWFIGYAFYHPRDWGETILESGPDCTDDQPGGLAFEELLSSLIPVVLCHENDMEGVLLAIDKSGGNYGAFLGAVTVVHTGFGVYTDQGIDSSDNDDVEFLGSHPLIYSEAKGHAVFAAKRWEVKGFPGGDGIIYIIGNEGQEPSPSSGKDTAVRYGLLSIEDLWARSLPIAYPNLWVQGDGSTFKGVFSSKANAPWGWGDEAELFTKPQKFMDERFPSLSLSTPLVNASFGSKIGLGAPSDLDIWRVAQGYESNGSTAVFGYPIDKMRRWGGGYIQDFQRDGRESTITLADEARKAYVVYGQIWDAYMTKGGPGGALGYPISPEKDGPTSPFPPEARTRRMEFEGGWIYHHASGNNTSTNVFLGHGIHTKWEALDFGKTNVGLPITDQGPSLPSGAPGFDTTGVVATFERGHIHLHRTGEYEGRAFETHGPIDELYVSMGGTASDLGFPVSDQRPWRDGARSEFEGGSIVWTPAGGARATAGAPGCLPPVADFVATNRTGEPPLHVQFTDLSSGQPTRWEWDLDTATDTPADPDDDPANDIDSTDRNPVNDYTEGVYSIKLTVFNECGAFDQEEKRDYVAARSGPEPLIADFTATPVSGEAPLPVQFLDISQGSPTAWSWDFGDGTPGSDGPGPLHTYEEPGNYDVRLTVSAGPTNDTTVTSAYITVYADPAPGVFRFREESYEVFEADAEVELVVVRSGGTSTAELSFTTQPGTAAPGLDYVRTSGTLRFAQGQNEARFAIRLLDDVTPEGLEHFQVRLTSASSGATIGSPSTANVFVTEDDTPATVQALSPVDDSPAQAVDSVTLRWSVDPAPAYTPTFTLFVVYADTDSFLTQNVVASGLTAVEFTLHDLPYGTPISWGVRMTDEAGVERQSDMFHFTPVADDAPPTGSISINDGAASTESYLVTLALSASDTGSGVRYMRFSNDGQSWGYWVPFGRRYAWHLADPDAGGRRGLDTYTVYARFRDEQGNVSGIYTDTIAKISGAGGEVILNGFFYETVRDAVAASEPGDTIYLTEGTFVIRARVAPPRYPNHVVGIVLKPGVSLVGAGPDKTRVVLESGLFTVIDAENTVIEGVTIAMTDPNGVRSAVLLESDGSSLKNSVIESSFDGIKVNGGDHVIVGNLIRSSGGTGIRIDAAGVLRVLNNTVLDNAEWGILQRAGSVTQLEVANNVFAFNGGYGVSLDAGISFSYNDVFGNQWNHEDRPGALTDQTGVGGNLSVDPLLNADGRLQSQSPLIDAGVDVGLPYAGTAPDIGAFEHDATGTLEVVSNRTDASFTVQGPQDQSGEGVHWTANLPVGQYVIEFYPLPGRLTPQFRSVFLAPGETLTLDGTYPIDNVPPEGIIILGYGISATASRLVDVLLEFNDRGSGLDDGALMRFSNDGLTWSEPEPYSTLRRDWDVTAFEGTTAGGPRTVHAQVADAAGNWSDPVSAQVLYAPDRRILEVPGQYATIQGAVDAAAEGDMVWVAPGSYQESVQLKPGVRLQGAGPPLTHLSQAIITADRTVVDGFTIQLVYEGVTVLGRGVVVSNNVFVNPRGVVVGNEATVHIRNNVFHTDPGQPAALVFGVMVVGGSDGGGQQVWVTNNTIVNAQISGILVQNFGSTSSVHLTNNIIVGSGQAAIFDNSGLQEHQQVFSSFNLFWDNAGGIYAGVKAGQMEGPGDSVANPLFRGPEDGDYSLATGSPAIDSGHPGDHHRDHNGTPNDRGASGGRTLNRPALVDLSAPAGPVGRGVPATFDASAADRESSTGLEYRWDWDEDGVFDTLFGSGESKATYAFPIAGTYTTAVQVRDADGLLSTAQATITVVNRPPFAPSNPWPEPNAAGQPVEVMLGWSGGDPDPSDELSYDVYFGEEGEDLALAAQGVSETTESVGALAPATTYVWQVVVNDGEHVVEGPSWAFTTAELPEDARCRYDADSSGFISRPEALGAVTDYLLQRPGITRTETLAIVSAYLLETSLTCPMP